MFPMVQTVYDKFDNSTGSDRGYSALIGRFCTSIWAGV